MATPIRVLVADDNPLVRQGLQAMLDSVDDVEVIGEAENGHEAIALTENLEPDVVVMDISMPRMDGLEATEQIQALKTDTRVLILSMHANPIFVRQALRKGARGYILKRTVSKELLPALYRVHEGELYLSPTVDESATDHGGD